MESKAFDKSISTAPTNFFWFKDILQLSIKPYGNMIGAIRFPKMIIPVKLKVKKVLLEFIGRKYFQRGLK